jgi:hypothetical protein
MPGSKELSEFKASRIDEQVVGLQQIVSNRGFSINDVMSYETRPENQPSK